MRVVPQVYKLMEAVRDRPYLYNQSIETFKNLAAKQRNWMEVARMVYGREDKATINKVKVQWKSLRDAFVKHQRKKRAAMGKIRPYVYEEEMQFLLPHIQGSEDYLDNIPIPIKTEVKTEDCQSISEESQNIGLDQECPQHDPEMPHQVVDVQGGVLWEQTSHNSQQHFNENSNEMHPVDAFFHGIAQTVKQLKPSTVARLKKTVANIVMDAELEEIQKAEKHAQNCVY